MAANHRQGPWAMSEAGSVSSQAPPQRDLVADLKAERAIGRTNPGRSPNVEAICRTWPDRFRKTQLAEELWPVLQAKVQRDFASGKRLRIPAARVAARALRMSLEISGRSIALRIR